MDLLLWKQHCKRTNLREETRSPSSNSWSFPAPESGRIHFHSRSVPPPESSSPWSHADWIRRPFSQRQCLHRLFHRKCGVDCSRQSWTTLRCFEVAWRRQRRKQRCPRECNPWSRGGSGFASQKHPEEEGEILFAQRGKLVKYFNDNKTTCPFSLRVRNLEVRTRMWTNKKFKQSVTIWNYIRMIPFLFGDLFFYFFILRRFNFLPHLLLWKKLRGEGRELRAG